VAAGKHRERLLEKSGDWVIGDWVIGMRGDLAIWRCGDLAMWRFGDVAMWRFDLAIAKSPIAHSTLS
jgi:hypothetical protein